MISNNKVAKITKSVVIVVLLVLIIGAFVPPEALYLITLHQNRESLSLGELSIRYGRGEPDNHSMQPEVGYTLKIVSFDGKILDSFKFEASLVLSEGLPTPEEYDYFIRARHFINAKSIEIYDESNQLALTIDVTQYSRKPGIEGLLNFDYIVAFILALVVIWLLRDEIKGARARTNK